MAADAVDREGEQDRADDEAGDGDRGERAPEAGRRI
jgi:hypothetical protein